MKLEVHLSRLAFSFVVMMRRLRTVREAIKADLSGDNLARIGKHIAIWSIALDVEPNAAAVMGMSILGGVDGDAAYKILEKVKALVEDHVEAQVSRKDIPLREDRIQALVRIASEAGDLSAAADGEKEQALDNLVSEASMPDGGGVIVSAISHLADQFMEHGNREDFEIFSAFLLEALSKSGHVMKLPEARVIIEQALSSKVGPRGPEGCDA